MHYSCLIVDDEEMIAQTTCEYFNLFEVSAFYVTGYEDCLAFFEEHQAQVLLLDINLGNRSGFELCRSLRRKFDIPILFISARTSDDDILTALNLGGDDYITKPYSLNILLAKVKAILRRCGKTDQEEAADTPDGGDMQKKPSVRLPCGQEQLPVRLDADYRRAMVDGKPVALKEMEFKLLRYLLENQGRVITREELFQNVWEDVFVGEGTLSVHIRHLRSKIEKDPDNPRYIRTQWGVGYIFSVEPVTETDI